jgi:hypothetical protein
MKRRLSDSIFALSEIECRLSASNSREAVAASMISFFWRSAFSCRFRSKASMLLSESARVTKGSFSFSSGLGSILPESSEQARKQNFTYQHPPTPRTRRLKHELRSEGVFLLFALRFGMLGLRLFSRLVARSVLVTGFP